MPRYYARCLAGMSTLNNYILGDCWFILWLNATSSDFGGFGCIILIIQNYSKLFKIIFISRNKNYSFITRVGQPMKLLRLCAVMCLEEISDTEDSADTAAFL